MPDKLGRIQKGERLSYKTEFKKGQHWRPHKIFRERTYLEQEYLGKKRSSSEIAAKHGVTDAAIIFWLRKHEIPRRTVSQARRVKHWGLSVSSKGMYGRRGADASNWKGGCSPDRQSFYSSFEWAKASIAVWKRDKHKCQRCDRPGRDIHHIVSFSVKELRAELNNLILLCVKCHHFVHSKKNKAREFIK